MVRMTGTPHGFDTSIDDPVQRIQQYIGNYLNNDTYKGAEAVLMRTIRIVAAENKPSIENHWICRAVFELEVVPELCNPMENMHGGAVALVADMATTMAAAPASSKGFWEFGGVTRTLGVTLLAHMPKGAVVEIDCKLVSVGKRMSLIQCEFRDKEPKALLAVAEHGKVAAGVQSKHLEG